MTNRELQRALQTHGHYRGNIDGIIGPQSRAAINEFLNRHGITNRGNWSNSRNIIAAKQLVCKLLNIEVGAIDGLKGPQTRFAFDVFAGKDVSTEELRQPKPNDSLPVQSNRWPRQTTAEMTAFYGRPGENLTTIDLPYTMKLAWDKRQKINRFAINARCAESAVRCFNRVVQVYNPSQIKDLGLDLFGGCFNIRNMRGASRPSTHSWGAAIDLDPERNQLRWPMSRARLGQPDAIPFWEIWESEGWVSLGRARNFDAMHYQASRL